MSDLNGISVASIIAADVMSFATLGTNFIKSRFLVLMSEFGTNEKEAAELERLADAAYCEIKQSGEGFSLEINVEEQANYYGVINDGTDPVAGGSGGIAHNPDGSTYHSAVKPSLWGTKLEWLAKKGIDILNEIKMMLTTIFKDHVQNAVENNRRPIGQAFAGALSGQMSFAF